MSVIAYTRQDGGVSVLIPILEGNYINPETGEWFCPRVGLDEVPEGFRAITIEDVAGKDVPTGLIYQILDQAPSDRTFRDAWRLADGISVDMGTAKNIWLDKWRAARAPLLDAMDIQYMRAQEQNDQASMDSIVAKKNALRDVTNTDLSGITTPEALKQVWPEILNG